MSLPLAPPLRTRLLDRGDAPLLQQLFERASDFFVMSEGAPPSPTAGEEEIQTTAPNKTLDDAFPLGFFDGEQLIAFAHVVRDFPKPREWWIGFLILDPKRRRQGLGASLHDALRNWIAAQSATMLWLGVLEQNGPGQRFWRRMGYEEKERQPHLASNGFRSTMILMRQALYDSSCE